MSKIQYEECSLEEATHVEVGGKVHELGIRPDDGYESKHQVLKYNRYYIKVYMKSAGWQLIHVDAFPILGIKLFKEVKPEPVEFEATFAMYDGKWHPLYSWNAGVSYQNSKKATFKCVQILEEEK
jgi:hypothetical protein